MSDIYDPSQEDNNPKIIGALLAMTMTQSRNFCDINVIN